MTNRRLALCGASFLILSSACTEPELDSSGQTSTATAVEDIRFLSIRPDGLFDVVCADGEHEVRSAEEIRNDEVCVTSLPGGFICTARDGDGIAPWSVARVSAGAVTVYRNVVFSQIEDCQDALGRRMDRREDTYVCGSRDRDGINPWTLYHLGNQATRLDRVVFKSLDDCFTSVDASTQDDEAALVCASRDRDGLAPWNVYALAGTSVERGDQRFSTLDSCFASLGGGSGESFLCVSRDNDGIAPWVLARREGVSVTRYNHAVYNNTEQCETAAEYLLPLWNSDWACASRDRDGINPWALVELSNNAPRPNMVYSSFEQCLEASDRALVEGAGALVCASRDRDGINPWSVYAILDSNSERTDLVFNSFDTCNSAVTP